VSAGAQAGFPLDDWWHKTYGIDVTMWSPTHLMMIGGASLAPIAIWLMAAEAGPVGMAKARWWLAGAVLIGLSTFQLEFDFGIPQFQLLFHPLLIVAAAGVGLVAARPARRHGGYGDGRGRRRWAGRRPRTRGGAGIGGDGGTSRHPPAGQASHAGAPDDAFAAGRRLTHGAGSERGLLAGARHPGHGRREPARRRPRQRLVRARRLAGRGRPARPPGRDLAGSLPGLQSGPGGRQLEGPR